MFCILKILDVELAPLLQTGGAWEGDENDVLL